MKGSVVVTGANSGIGWHITKLLNEKQIPVFACARREEAFSAFEGFSHVTPVLLDVTDEESIARAGE